LHSDRKKKPHECYDFLLQTVIHHQRSEVVSQLEEERVFEETVYITPLENGKQSDEDSANEDEGEP